MDNDEFYEYAWSLRGERFHSLKPGNRTQRMSMIAALNQNTLHSPFIFEGYTNKDVFMLYFEQVLIPNLKSGEVVVIDNASFHKGDKSAIICEAIRLIYERDK